MRGQGHIEVQSNSSKKWLVCAPLHKDSRLGIFNNALFNYLEQNGHEVVGYLTELPLENSLGFSSARFILAEMFCSEQMLFEEVKRNLDSKIMEDLDGLLIDSTIQRSYFRITDRMMSVPQSSVRRGNLLRLTLAFWLTIIDELKIEAIWFGSTPHFGYDTVLANLAHRKGIKIFMPQRTEYKSVYLLSSGIGAKKYLQRSIPVELDLRPAWIDYSKRLISDSLVHNSRSDQSLTYRASTLWRYLKDITHLILRRLLQERWFRGFSPIYMTNHSFVTFLFSMIYRVRQSRCLWREYCEVASTDLPETYIFFAWSFQPERSTDPEAGLFADLEFCVHFLLRELPSNWSLVVKEHPRQFDGPNIDIRKLHFRAEGVYRRLSQVDRVVLADLSLDSTGLASNAIGCVTTTGSIGFEALKMGIKVGCFGNPWYAGLKNCYSIGTAEGLKFFLRVLQSSMGRDHSVEFNQRVAAYISNYAFIIPSFNAKDDDFSLEEIHRMGEVLATAISIGQVTLLEETN